MPELLTTRVQDVNLLETTVKELKVECGRAQKPRFQVRLTLLPKCPTSSTTWTLTSHEEGCHEADQAGCGRTDHGEIQQLQARLDEITTKRDGTKKDVSDRDTRMKRGGLCQRS